MRPVTKLIIGVPLFWYPISMVHEIGHYAFARIGGATGVEIVWRNYVFSETIRTGSRWPILDVWMGPVIGIIIPLVIAYTLRKTKLAEWVAWFAAIACIANGLYIGIGWMDVGGDSSDMITQGCPLAFLIGFGLSSFSIGLFLLMKNHANEALKPSP